MDKSTGDVAVAYVVLAQFLEMALVLGFAVVGGWLVRREQAARFAAVAAEWLAVPAQEPQPEAGVTAPAAESPRLRVPASVAAEIARGPANHPASSRVAGP